MAKPPSTPSPGNIKKFFQTIQGLGIPSKVDQAYLKTIGFKAANDRNLIAILRYIDFIDGKGTPTEKWKDFKDKAKAPKVMASSIKTAYADLFSTYLDAEKRDSATIQNYFAPKWGVSELVTKRMEQTFKQLGGLADFGAVAVTEPVTKPPVPTIKEVAEIPTGVRPVTININIQLQLPATEDATIYDNLFSALKKHLFS